MNRFVWIVVGYLALGVSGHVHAAESHWWFAKAPPWYGEDVPEVLLCESVGEMIDCETHILPFAVEVQLKREGEGVVYTQDWLSFTHLECRHGVCRDIASSEPRGEYGGLGTILLEGQVVSLPRGYYVTTVEDQAIVAFQEGTGPLGETYPPIYVEDDDNAWWSEGSRKRQAERLKGMLYRMCWRDRSSDLCGLPSQP
jgi:hypothetical protein